MLPSAAVFFAVVVAVTATSPRRVQLLADVGVLAASDDSYRLPTAVVPLHYQLRLEPKLEDDFRFSGTVAITLRADDATANITFHADDIEVAEGSVAVEAAPAQGTSYKVTAQLTDDERDFYTVTVDPPLAAGETYTLKLDYHGYHRTDMEGFYRSWYLDENNNTVWLVTTDFEPTAARRAFPCFDEPALKATFQISIAAPKDLHAISNMPVASTELDAASGRTWYHFEQTPMPMSTYLVAFVVSAFQNTTNGFVSVWSQPALVSQGGYAAELGPKVIEALENFTQVNYFLPKMDQVAIPDFTAGAMENYGIVTYRERMLLFAEDESTSTYKQSITTVIAHEFSHQWFGDLVGPRWWKYIWLNEGFATYFEYFAAAVVQPSWRLDEQFVVEEIHSSAFTSDSYNSTHPMTFEHVSTPSQISNTFDSISYAKAGSVIRMIDHVMGHDSFRKGLNLYLNANGNNTAEDQDLFNSLSQQYKADPPNSAVDFQDFLDSWARQKGYPVITVTRNYTDDTVKVSQERFLLSGESTSGDGISWWVPITYATKSNPNFQSTSPSAWLNRSEAQKTLDGVTINKGDWVVFNVQQTGYYRVNYDAENWELLVRQLNSDQFGAIPPVNRAQILNDAFNLVSAGRLGRDVLWRLVSYLSRETDYIPWNAALDGLSDYVDSVKASSTHYSFFKDFVLSLIKNSYDTLGFEEKPNDDHVTKLYRNLILTWACKLDYAPCLESAASKFKAFIADNANNKVEPDLRKVVYCYGLQQGSYDDYAALWRRYLSTTVATEKTLLLGALGCTRNDTAFHELLLKTRSSNQTEIRAQDQSVPTSAIFNTKYGIDSYISYIAEYYKVLYPNDTEAVISAVITAASYAWTQEQYQKLEQFLETNKQELGITGSVDQYLAFTKQNFAKAGAEGSKLQKEIKQMYRLPTALIPASYSVKVRPHLTEGNFTFDGDVEVRVRAAESTDRVVLHANDVAVHEASTTVTPADGGEALTVQEQAHDDVRQFYTVIVEEGLEAGKEYDVHLSYVGQLRDDMNGFYRSYYNVNGAKRWLASTQFESTGARRAFPCFDEPALKANITLTIERPSKYNSVSNMELYNSTDVEGEEDLKRDVFMQTPPMSTYLLAFIVSDFVKTADAVGNITLWHRSSTASQAAYAVNVSRSLLKFMEAYTDIPFALPKMDQAAIPDFSAGAMENWGLVTYRDRLILFDEALSTTADKQNIATTIAHEFAHQWFGDLVSPEWWSYSWLNEGFATYFELFAAAGALPDWRLEDQFVVMKLQPSLASDAYAATHAITSDVYTPAEIEAVFDYVSYGKAGSVLRMASHFLTQKVFQRGLSEYLKDRSYSTGTPEYLFAALQKAATEAGLTVDVAKTLNTWTLQEGYPLVSVDRNRTTGSITVSQERFLIVQDDSSTSDSEREKVYWSVPLTYTTKSNSNFGNTNETIWLDGPSLQINSSVKNEDWVIFNLQEIGFYRVAYDEANWALLTAQLNSDQYQAIHAANRAQLLDDSLNLARAGKLSYTAALDLAKYLVRETDYVPWSSAFTAFNYLNVRLSGMASDQYAVFKDFVLSLISPLYTKLGFHPKADDDHATRLLRANVVSWACKLELADCVNTAKDLFNKKMKSSAPIVPADVSSAAYCTALRHGGENEWGYLKKVYDESDVATEQVLILSALGCTANDTLINKYLSLSITADSGIRKQDAASVFSAVYVNPAGVDNAFKFLTENYDKISEFYGGMGSIGNIITGIADKLSHQAQVDKLKEFVESNRANLGRALAASTQAVETAEGNLRWLDDRGKVIGSWLQAWKKGQQGGNTPGGGPGEGTAPTVAPLLLLAAVTCAGLLF